MQILIYSVLVYLAIGAAFFSHPPAPAVPGDFGWRRQSAVFCRTLPEVLCWPLSLWRFLTGDPGRP